ncbi:MAG: HlyD family efflux transporter periplasmic adaptor subunit [Pirellulales bacterium]|nr:HlyD family efflux transporter periplasmic adaptor subunit [Pirellulales bacterium]
MNVLFPVLTAIALAGQAPAERGNSAPIQSAGEVTLPRCLLALIEEAEVPAREAGQLVALEAYEGQSVDKDDFLGQIDDSIAKMEKIVAQKELAISEEEASSMINIHFSEKATKVAQMEYEKAVDANKQFKETVSHSELMKRLFEWERSRLSIEKALQDQKIAKLTADAKGAQVDASDQKIQHRVITAPIPGIVVRKFKKYGEWVNPGDPVVRIIRMDRLRIEGLVDADYYSAVDLNGRRATVRAELPHGRVEQFDGKIVYVHPEIEPGHKRRVWAEVVNRREDDEWLLQPGLRADMTIHLQSPAVGAEGLSGSSAPNQGRYR